VERRVEAGHARHAGQRRLDRVQGGQRLGLVQRRQVGQGFQPLPHPRIHHHGGPEQRAAVHDPVPDRVRFPERADGVLQRGGVGGPGRGRQVGRAGEAVTGVEQPQFQAARPGVDDQDC